MKFSPVLPFALSSLITTSLAAPHALRQPAPQSAAEPMGRRSSATGLLPVAAPAAPAVQSSNIDHVIDFGMGTPLLSARNNAKRSDNEKRYTTEEASQMIGFGTGEDLQLVKEKRSDNEKRYTTEEASQMIGFGTGEELQLVKEKRADNEKRYTTEEASQMIGFGTGEELQLVKEKRADNEKRYTTEEASQMIGFGTGEDLQLVKEKRSDNEKRYTIEEASQMIGFGTGEDLALVKKEKRTDLGNPGQQSSTELAASAIGFGTGETLAPVSMSSLAVRDDPLIRRKVAELAALIKERAPEASIHDILIREASPIPDIAAPAA